MELSCVNVKAYDNSALRLGKCRREPYRRVAVLGVIHGYENPLVRGHRRTFLFHASSFLKNLCLNELPQCYDERLLLFFVLFHRRAKPSRSVAGHRSS